MTTTPADKADEASAADPCAIDLEPYKEFPTQVTSNLIAVVEALRERVAKLEGDVSSLDWAAERVKAAEEDAEAAEAYVVELAGALQEIAEGMSPTNELLESGPSELFRQMLKWSQEKARTALAATPAKALKRATLTTALITVSGAVIDSGRRLRSDPGSHELALANLCNVMEQIAKLDALGKKEG